MREGELAIGIDIGGTNTKLGVINRSGEVMHRLVIPTEEAKGGEHLMAKLIAASRQLLAESKQSLSGFAGIGIGSPGLIDVEKGTVADCPGKIPGWTGMPVARRMSLALGLPASVDNDVKVIARGEGWMGAGKGAKHFVCFALGTGIGGGIVIDGKLYHGAGYCSAMVGHIVVEPNGPRCICGGRGCLECYASGPSIAAEAASHIMRGVETSMEELAEGDISRIDASLVFQAAEAGDQVAREIVERAGFYLGIAVVTVIHLLNPERVIIGGGVARGGKLLLEPVRRVVKQRAWQRRGFKVEILPSELGDDAGIFGAAALAFSRSKAKP
jgi:glucokinase